MKNQKIDIIDLDIPNVCFSNAKTLPKNDERIKLFKKQRLKRGFDNSELWDLDYTIAQFILPRLKAFKDSKALKTKIVNKIIKSFEMVLEGLPNTAKQSKEFEKGMKLFVKHYCDLWN